jgi:hypothetical protein
MYIIFSFYPKFTVMLIGNRYEFGITIGSLNNDQSVVF